jgi:hypothetical protein
MAVTDLAPLVAGGPDAPGRTVRAALRRAAPALLLHAAVRALGIVVLAGWAQARGKDWHRLLCARWDSLWYTGIAEHGYGHTLHLADGRVHSDLAFFPLLPGFERLITGVTPLSVADAGLTVSWTASLAAAWGIFEVGTRCRGPRTGLLLAVLWAAVPVGIVQSMAYTESLFTALAAWALYAVLTGRWVRAGALAALAGLTRPTGAAVVAAVWTGAALALRRGAPAPERTRILLAAALAPAGWLGYVLWVAVRTGSPTGYLTVQSRWGNGFDGGRAFAGFVWKQLTGPDPVAGAALAAGLALIGCLYALCLRQRLPPAVLAYCGAAVLLALCGAGYFGSRPRLLLPAFPLLLPAAGALARARPATTALTLAAVALASAVYGAFWLNGSGPP